MLNTCTKRALSLSSFIHLSIIIIIIIIIIFGLSIAFGFRLFELHLPFFIMNSANRKMNSNSRMNSNFLLLFFLLFLVFNFQFSKLHDPSSFKNSNRNFFIHVMLCFGGKNYFLTEKAKGK